MKRERSREDPENMTEQELEKRLTDKQKAFVREYLLDKNGTQAAIRAGYKAGKDDHAAAVTASRLLHDPAINAYRRALQREAFRRMGITLESLCADLVEIKERCMQQHPVMAYNKETREYEETGEWQFDAKGATKAIAELANLLDVKEQAREKTGGLRMDITTEDMDG